MSLVIVAIVAASFAAAQGTRETAPAARARMMVPLVAEEVFSVAIADVQDGDTLTVQVSGKSTRLHLDGVDAPELSQEFGPEAKAYLAKMVAIPRITVRVKAGATIGRERLARIEAVGTDLAVALVRAGLAWYCPRQAEDPDLAQAEREARAAKRGLWSAPRQTPPWTHRGAESCWAEM